MVDQFQDKVVIVTGASAGIGRATALAFAVRGARVVVSDINEEKGRQVVQEIVANEGTAIFVKADVSREADVQHLVERAVEAFGGLHFAVNNAGIEGTPAPTGECSAENWARTLAVNLTGVWLCMKYQLPHLLAAGGGAIINVSSIAGLKGIAAMPAYTASKHGVVGLTKTAALDYATQNVRVNAICPAAIDTEMIQRFCGGDQQAMAGMHAMQPIGRMGTSEEVADAALFLCTDQARFLTGVILPVDGGVMAG
ncbi:MAG: glucose 1-dehydrogenase [Bradymonadaceae bacterium]|nr:glucose 1-dehydrogenase [Lujinxingiaceae bacterium]